MVIKPMIRSNICLNAHPGGCKKNVEDYISYTKNQQSKRDIVAKTAGSSLHTPKAVLVLGCSNGYGLSSRIVASFGYNAATVGVSFEKEGSQTKGGTPGWYNNLTFDEAAKNAHIPYCTINGDAFSDDIKNQVIAAAKNMGITFDLVVYSLASPVRTDPDTGIMYKSVIKPFGKPYSGVTVDPMSGKMSIMTAEPASEDEAANTVKVMGGEDWQRWIAQLSKEGVLAKGCRTIAYSYIGPELSQAIYRNGTIGKAKEHLESTAHDLNEILKNTLGGSAYISVNKGLVTRASAVIPIIPLYLSILFKVMKAKGKHEGCIEQINRLYVDFLYAGKPVPTDDENRIRIDDWEMASDVQCEIDRIMPQVTEENINELTDIAGYRHDFLATSGFDIAGVDYEKDISDFSKI